MRIFLGTETAQQRAERVFIWSIERVRDPSRVYEIHLMKDLPGFDRSRWTTGFTNYRFAIPALCAGQGRALYNDVDQIYVADPAELFDMEMGGHGFLAVAETDSSVMLIDCARAARVWALEAAQLEHKARLLRRALREPGMYGPLAPEWNARDEEFAPGRSKLLHYTTLHTQPWRPFPRHFVYQENAHGKLWFDLERSADEAGFQVFTRARPSARYRDGLDRSGACIELDAVPDDDLPWVLDELFREADGPVRAAARFEAPPGKRRLPAPWRRTADWWAAQLEATAARHPEVRWRLELRGAEGRQLVRQGGPRPGGAPPRVWVLADDRPGNTTQSLGLAAALGWPVEVKRLRSGLAARLHNRLLGASRRGIDAGRSSPLDPPWPDLVIAAGRRTAPVALWIREQSGGVTRLVQLGRKGGDAAELFDLVATPAYCRLFPHPRRIETGAPLHGVTEARLAEAAKRWRARLEAAPGPRIALLVGGTSGQYRLDAATARRLGEDVMRMARETGGSVFATASRRAGREATDALCEALDGAAWVHRWSPDDADNPYLGFLALADAFVITGDSESMLAEATSLGRPVYIYPLPTRPSFRILRALRDWVVARGRASPHGMRGTPRPQQGLEYLCARLVDRGFVRPARDLDRLHEDLVRRGVAQRFGAPYAPGAGEPLRDMEAVAARARALMGAGPLGTG